jgi:hypothetical protein
MMTLCIDLMEKDRKNLINTLTSLAHSHSAMGVLAHQYGTFTTVLLATLEEVLGPTAFYAEIKSSWEKAFSRLLEVLVPVAIHDGMIRARNSTAVLLEHGQSEMGNANFDLLSAIIRQTDDDEGLDSSHALNTDRLPA